MLVGIFNIARNRNFIDLEEDSFDTGLDNKRAVNRSQLLIFKKSKVVSLLKVQGTFFLVLKKVLFVKRMLIIPSLKGQAH